MGNGMTVLLPYFPSPGGLYSLFFILEAMLQKLLQKLTVYIKSYKSMNLLNHCNSCYLYIQFPLQDGFNN